MLFVVSESNAVATAVAAAVAAAAAVATAAVLATAAAGSKERAGMVAWRAGVKEGDVREVACEAPVRGVGESCCCSGRRERGRSGCRPCSGLSGPDFVCCSGCRPPLGSSNDDAPGCSTIAGGGMPMLDVLSSEERSQDSSPRAEVGRPWGLNADARGRAGRGPGGERVVCSWLLSWLSSWRSP